MWELFEVSMSLRPLKVLVATSLKHAHKIISSLTFHVKPHCLMIMVLQVGEQGQLRARASSQRRAAVVRLLFHAVSISSAAAVRARSCLVPGLSESGWAAAWLWLWGGGGAAGGRPRTLL